MAKVEDDGELLSSNSHLRQLQPRVETMSIVFPVKYPPRHISTVKNEFEMPEVPLNCEPFWGTADFAALQRRFGKANVEEVEYLDLKTFRKKTLLYEPISQSRALIVWRDPVRRKGVKEIQVSENLALKWTIFGLRMKSTVVDLEQLNGGPFLFDVSETDKHGSVTFSKQFHRRTAPCELAVKIYPGADFSSEADKDGQVSSSRPAFHLTYVQMRSISLIIPPPKPGK